MQCSSPMLQYGHTCNFAWQHGKFVERDKGLTVVWRFYEELGAKLCAALPAFHALTRRDFKLTMESFSTQ